MSRPRQILPGRFYLITRRCTQRQFLLRPDEVTNNAFIYCLAIAANRCEIDVLCSVAESNHHHTVIFDRYGRVSEFIEQFHRLFARSQNAYRGHWENFWSSEEPCVTCLVDPETVIDKLVYALTNPVKDHLVERVRHWPGVNTYADLMSQRPLEASRPRHFFRRGGSMPTHARLELTIPPELGDRTAVVTMIRERVEAVEHATREERLRNGTKIVGRRNVLKQDWRESPTSVVPRRRLRPRFAGRPTARQMAIANYLVFLVEYRMARRCWLAGGRFKFPAGTYWLVRFAAIAASSISN